MTARDIIILISFATVYRCFIVETIRNIYGRIIIKYVHVLICHGFLVSLLALNF